MRITVRTWAEMQVTMPSWGINFMTSVVWISNLCILHEYFPRFLYKCLECCGGRGGSPIWEAFLYASSVIRLTDVHRTPKGWPLRKKVDFQRIFSRFNPEKKL